MPQLPCRVPDGSATVSAAVSGTLPPVGRCGSRAGECSAECVTVPASRPASPRIPLSARRNKAFSASALACPASALASRRRSASTLSASASALSALPAGALAGPPALRQARNSPVPCSGRGPGHGSRLAGIPSPAPRSRTPPRRPPCPPTASACSPPVQPIGPHRPILRPRLRIEEEVLLHPQRAVQHAGRRS